MKKLQTVKADRLALYEKATVKGLSFVVDGNTFKSVVITTDLGPLEIRKEGYSEVQLYEPAIEKKWRVTVTDSKEQFPTITKDFDEEYKRDVYARDFDTMYDRFKVAVSEYEQLADGSVAPSVEEDNIPF
jgi:hypothetical protein